MKFLMQENWMSEVLQNYPALYPFAFGLNDTLT